jgi:membrane protease YdiL (CAAX protease family)
MARYPVAAFFLLAVTLGSSTVYLVATGLLPSGLTVGAALSASLSGMIMSALLEGRAGLKRLLRRLLVWRVGIGYWVFAALFLAPAVLLGALANPLFHGDPLIFKNMQPPFAIVPMFLLFLIVAGLGQELGWTGFLLPRLQSRYHALTACLIRTLLVGVWHLPLLLYSRLDPAAFASIPYGSWISQLGFPAALAVMLLMFMLPWSILFTWLFNDTGGSLLLVVILHGSEIWLPYWMLGAGINPDNINNYWGYGALLVMAAILIVLVNGPENLSHRYPRVVHQQKEKHSYRPPQ